MLFFKFFVRFVRFAVLTRILMLAYGLVASYLFYYLYGDSFVQILTTQPQEYFYGMIIFGVLGGLFLEAWLGKIELK